MDYDKFKERRNKNMFCTADEIDAAEFSAKISVLADHTLSGQIIAPNGLLPTYAQMIEHQGANEGTKQLIIKCVK